MDAFYERLIVRAATIDELLSDDFEPLPGQKGDTDLAARRLAAWCRSCASGDWSLFDRRLERDGLAIAQVLARFAAVRRKASAAPPAWIEDAIWLETALQEPGQNAAPIACAGPGRALCVRAAVHATGRTGRRAALVGYRRARARQLERSRTRVSAPGAAQGALQPRHAGALRALRQGAQCRRNVSGRGEAAARRRHVALRSLRRRHESRRLPATVRRQAGAVAAVGHAHAAMDRHLARIGRCASMPIWRRSADASALPAPTAALPRSKAISPIRTMTATRSGSSSFEDGARVVYKPKDLRLDAAWHALVERLNRAKPPVELKAVHAIARDGYGWTEFIDHAGCADQEGCKRFFRRAGAWLALFHCFAATDMHQENMIASGDHPVPIDLEMILQAAAEERNAEDPEDQAFDAAIEIVANSVMTVGLLPAYGRSPDNNVFAVGGMTADWNSKTEVTWDNINSDAMRPAKAEGGRQDHPESAACRRPQCQVRRPRRRLRRGLCRVRELPAGADQGRQAGRPVRRICRRPRPQGHSRHPVLLHAAAASEKPPKHGRRRDLVGASGFRRQAVGLGQESIRCGRCSGPNARRSSRSTCRISCRPATATTSAMRPAFHSVRGRLGPRSRPRARPQLRRAGYRLADRGHPQNTSSISQSPGPPTALAR